MAKMRFSSVAAVVAISLGLAACGGGGGGNLADSIPTSLLQIAAPAPVPPPPVPVTSNTPGSFDGSSGAFPQAGTVFSATVSDGSPLTLAIVSADQNSTTFKITDAYGTYTLFFPATLATPGYWWSGPAYPLANQTSGQTGTSPWGISYVSLGTWNHGAGAFEGQFYMFGYETPVLAMPVSGSASFQGQNGVRGLLQDGSAALRGDANLSVNFASGQVTGKLTNMQAIDTCFGVLSSWNDVAVNASITAGTNKFSGSTSAASQPASLYAVQGTATGTISGGFYGPAADNLGGLWTLSDGKMSASGGVAAHR